MASSQESENSENRSSASLLQSVRELDDQVEDYARLALDQILGAALNCNATDIHLFQDQQTLTVQFRIFGSLNHLGCIPIGGHTNVLSRLKALAHMITYRSDIPQEGRLQLTSKSKDGSKRLEARVGTLPTLHGERAVIRLQKQSAAQWRIADLNLPDNVRNRLREQIHASSGVILITGPAASGKTTSAYACVREILASSSDRSIVTLEDPVEQELAGVAQSEINASSDYTWSAGLKALLRQDPDVLLIGEIRDSETANVAFQAAMTGQLVIATMHARSAVDALQRLIDLGVQPHHLRRSLDFLSCQRLLPTICDCEKQKVASTQCNECAGIGIRGYTMLAELLPELTGELSQSLLSQSDSHFWQQAVSNAGMVSLAEQAKLAVEQGTILQADADRQIQRGID